MNYEEFLEKLPDMTVSRPVEAAIFSAMFVVQDIGGLESVVFRAPGDIPPDAIVLFGNRLAVDMDRLCECLGDNDAVAALDVANPYPVKLGRHTESSFSEATYHVGNDWLRAIRSYAPRPFTVEVVAETLLAILADMKGLGDVTAKEIRIQLEKEFRRATGETAPVVEAADADDNFVAAHIIRDGDFATHKLLLGFLQRHGKDEVATKTRHGTKLYVHAAQYHRALAKDREQEFASLDASGVGEAFGDVLAKRTSGLRETKSARGVQPDALDGLRRLEKGENTK